MLMAPSLSSSLILIRQHRKEEEMAQGLGCGSSGATFQRCDWERREGRSDKGTVLPSYAIQEGR